MGRLALSASAPLLLDVTRLVSRLRLGGLTGVDRVEAAWLRRALEHDGPVFCLVRTRWGWLLLDRAGGQALLQRLGRADPDDAPLRWARGVAIDRAHRLGLARLLRRHGAGGGVYLNTGHSNLTLFGLWAIGRAGLCRVVLVHDTIPLDHPQWARAGTVPRFRRKMRAVARHADRVIHTTATTRRVTERWLASFGRVPPGVVAPLGLDIAPPDPAAVPPRIAALPRFFLCVGTLEPRKNHLLLVETWEALARDPEVAALPPLVLAGRRGWLGPEAVRRLDASPLQGTAILEVSGLSDGALTALYDRAEALVMPSLAEGYGLPPLEAAARGCPVLVADLPVYHETLGALPVYLPPMQSYPWQTTIKQMLAAFGQARRVERAVAPRWQDHFKRALPELAQRVETGRKGTDVVG